MIKTQFLDREIEIRIWNGESLANVISLDTETTLTEFHQTPDLVTFQAYNGGNCVYYVRRRDVSTFLQQHSLASFVMHNAAFDVDVICKHLDNPNLFDPYYENNKIYDIGILYRLVHLAQQGYVPRKYNLNLISTELLNHELNKDEDIRLNFHNYINHDVSEIPRNFLEYGAEDVLATHYIFNKLLARAKNVMYSDEYFINRPELLLSHHIQIKGDLALLHIRKNGVGFNLDKAGKLLDNLNNHLDKVSNRLANWNWVRGKQGSKEAYEQAITILGLTDKLPRTESGEISSKTEDLLPYKQNEFINDYIQFHETEKLTTFIRNLDSQRIHARYDLLKNTGRTGCSKPNMQQLPRQGGIRQLFRAEEGNTFIITDYSAVELCTLAQITYNKFGHSVMREKINNGDDLHKYYASILYNCDLSEVTKDMRQKAKAANFGFPGGLGIHTFIEFSRTYGLDLSEQDAREMRRVWFTAFPECKQYLEDDGTDWCWTLTGRKRGNCRYTAQKNTPFQGLAADGAKLALYNLDRSGFRINMFVHDEIVCEVPENLAERKKRGMESIMIEAMSSVCPDVNISVESQISGVYTK